MSIELGNRLAALRRERSLSQDKLAEKLGISRQAVSKWERGESSPDTHTLIELARIYGVSLDELVGNEPSENTHDKKSGNERPVYIINRNGGESSHKKRADGEKYSRLGKKMLKFPFPVFAVAAYIFIGMTFRIWHPTWMIFLLIPAYYQLCAALTAKSKKAALMSMPVIWLALIVFLAAGFAFSAWKYAWIAFIAAMYYHFHIGAYYREDAKK